MLDTAEHAGQPFFFHLSYNDPHPPYFTPAPFDTQVDPTTAPLPPRHDGDDQPAWQKRVAADFADRAPTDDELRSLVATYYEMIGHADYQIGRVIDELRQRGLLQNTWIIHASDHGDFCGDKGLFSHTESLYECLLHVPLLIRPPDNADQPRGKLVDGFVELADLFPTMLGIAGAPTPDYAQGHDLMSWVRAGAETPLRERVFAQVGDYHGGLGSTLRGGRPKSARRKELLQGVRDFEFAYVCDAGVGDEAYDLRQDPAELHNLLLNGAAGASRVDEARRQIDANHEACVALRDRLGIVAGDRGFYDGGWE